MNETNRTNAVSILLCFSGFGAGAFSINELAQILGTFTAFISALSVAYQIVINANAQSVLLRAQAQKEQALAEKEQSEAKKIDAQAEKQQIENDKLTNQKNKPK